MKITVSRSTMVRAALVLAMPVISYGCFYLIRNAGLESEPTWAMWLFTILSWPLGIGMSFALASDGLADTIGFFITIGLTLFWWCLLALVIESGVKAIIKSIDMKR